MIYVILNLVSNLNKIIWLLNELHRSATCVQHNIYNSTASYLSIENIFYFKYQTFVSRWKINWFEIVRNHDKVQCLRTMLCYVALKYETNLNVTTKLIKYFRDFYLRTYFHERFITGIVSCVTIFTARYVKRLNKCLSWTFTDSLDSSTESTPKN